MEPQGRQGWTIFLYPKFFRDGNNPYELGSFVSVADAVAEARKHMARELKESDIEKAARRLQAARGEEESAETERGEQAGRIWALERAMPSELEAALQLSHSWWMSIDPRTEDDDSDSWPTLYVELGGLIPNAPDEPFQIDRDPFMVAFFAAAAETYEEIRQAERAASDTPSGLTDLFK